MFRILLTLLATIFIVPIQLAAQDGDAPSIAILSFGPSSAMELTESAILDVLESYGFISSEENGMLQERQTLEGENLSVYWGDAGFDLASVNLLLESALDRDVDVLVTLSTPVTQAAAAITSEMDDPPVVLFTAVQAPYRAGIADASCIKPDHIGGALTHTEYESVFNALRLQDPDLDTVGFVYATPLTSGEYALKRITNAAAEAGIAVQEAGITTLSDVALAAQGLIGGAGALLISGDYLMSAALPIVVAVANENAVPVFHPTAGSILSGVTIGAGYSSFYERGENLGVMLTGHLNGDFDIAASMIHADGLGNNANLLGINLDSAAEQNVEISQALMDQAQAMLVVSDGTVSLAETSPVVLMEFARQGVILPVENRLEEDMAFLASLACTDEMIAEQQAALDAAG